MQVDLMAIAQVFASAFGAWLAIRVELRWLRADVARIEHAQAEHIRLYHRED